MIIAADLSQDNLTDVLPFSFFILVMITLKILLHKQKYFPNSLNLKKKNQSL